MAKVELTPYSLCRRFVDYCKKQHTIEDVEKKFDYIERNC